MKTMPVLTSTVLGAGTAASIVVFWCAILGIDPSEGGLRCIAFGGAIGAAAGFFIGIVNLSRNTP